MSYFTVLLRGKMMNEKFRKLFSGSEISLKGADFRLRETKKPHNLKDRVHAECNFPVKYFTTLKNEWSKRSGKHGEMLRGVDRKLPV